MKVKVFHGSLCDFNKIELFHSFDLGFHCGTLNQAICRLNDDSGNIFEGFIYEVNIDVNSKNTVTVDDCISWANFGKVMNEFKSAKYDLKDCKTLEDIREKLVNDGIKFIRYKNVIEGKGYSYILLTSEHELIKHTVEDLLYKIGELIQNSELS